MNRARRERGVLWQGRFFDPAPLPLNIFGAGRRRALRTVKEYNEKVEYIHLNPVKAGLVKRCRQTQEFLWRKRHAARGLAVVEGAGVYGKRERAGGSGQPHTHRSRVPAGR